MLGCAIRLPELGVAAGISCVGYRRGDKHMDDLGPDSLGAQSAMVTSIIGFVQQLVQA